MHNGVRGFPDSLSEVRIPGRTYDIMLSNCASLSAGEVARTVAQYQNIRANLPDTQWLARPTLKDPPASRRSQDDGVEAGQAPYGTMGMLVEAKVWWQRVRQRRSGKVGRWCGISGDGPG